VLAQPLVAPEQTGLPPPLVLLLSATEGKAARLALVEEGEAKAAPATLS
jgi:hypothetical protein